MPAASAAPAPSRSVPWELRFSLALPLPAAAFGALFSVALFAVYAALGWGFEGRIWDLADPGGVVNARAHATLVPAILVGYLLAGSRHVAVASWRDLREVVPAANTVAVGPRGVRVIGDDEGVIRASRFAGAVGMLGGLVAEAYLLSRTSAPLTPAFAFTNLLYALLGWCVGRMSYFAVQHTRDINRLAREEVEIDLLDLKRLGGFGRVSLRLSLVVILGVSILIVGGLVDPNPQDVAPALPVILMALAFTVVCAVLALVVPVRGLQRRIRAAKRAELARLDAELRSIRAAGDATPGRVADLVALHAHIGGLREWPFDASMLRRFGLYLLIPLGSWLGGAFVERMVNTVLD